MLTILNKISRVFVHEPGATSPERPAAFKPSLSRDYRAASMLCRFEGEIVLGLH